jgi:hypothetical protein
MVDAKENHQSHCSKERLISFSNSHGFGRLGCAISTNVSKNGFMLVRRDRKCSFLVAAYFERVILWCGLAYNTLLVVVDPVTSYETWVVSSCTTRKE